MHRVVSLGHIDDGSDGVHLDALFAAMGKQLGALVRVARSEELWDALWDATVQLYHGAASRGARARRARAACAGDGGAGAALAC